MEKLPEIIEKNPVIIAIKNDKELEKSLSYDNQVVFMLYGDICTISEKVDRLKNSGKIVIVHEDLISGLSSDDICSEFIKKYTKADGIITTRPNNINKAKKLGLFAILRFFVMDSLSYKNINKTLNQCTPDIIDILPGVMPKILKRISEEVKVPIIAGGLISDKEDIIGALKAGCIGISTTDSNIWSV